MNITPFDIYLVAIADNLSSAFNFFSFLSLGTSAISFMLSFRPDANDGFRLRMRKLANRAIVSFFVCFAFAILTPSSKTIAAMFVIPKLANSELVTKDIPDAGKAILGLATEWMRAQTKAIKQEAMK